MDGARARVSIYETNWKYNGSGRKGALVKRVFAPHQGEPHMPDTVVGMGFGVARRRTDIASAIGSGMRGGETLLCSKQ